MAFDEAKHPRGPGGQWMGMGPAAKKFVGRLDHAERQRRIKEAHEEARKFLTGEKRPEWYSPQMIALHGRWNRDPHEAYESALDSELRWASVHPETEKYAGDVRRRAMLAKKFSARDRFRRARVGRAK